MKKVVVEVLQLPLIGLMFIDLSKTLWVEAAY